MARGGAVRVHPIYWLISTQASTVQILGAEKALFRALKTKHDTPKYGPIQSA
jgi:nucleolar protein 58